MKPRGYVEFTIVSYLTARPTRDLVRAAEQEITREWWDARHAFERFVWQLVLDESAAGHMTHDTLRPSNLVLDAPSNFALTLSACRSYR